MTQMQIMAGIIPLIVLLLSFSLEIQADEQLLRNGKFSIFQIIKFENAPCVGGTRNGTCFTSAECDSAGGTEDGNCADGFGVCCSVTITSGESTSLNQSYIVETTPASGTYRICPCSTDVCRIRFDFTTFTLAAPFTAATMGQAVTAAGAANNIAQNSGQSIGDCLTDQFSITGSGGSGTPIICGTNTGQHVIVDSDGSACAIVSSSIGTTAATTTRSLDIMVTQFKCGDEMGGPSGCLQWHTSAAGFVRSFNFPDQAAGTNVASTVTHLSSQKYNICIRQPTDTTMICYIACTSQAAVQTVDGVATMQASFGLSISPNAAAQSDIGANCVGDYITIIGGDLVAVAIAQTPSLVGPRFCGRELNTASGNIVGLAAVSLCTTSVPFQIGVNFDEDEISGGFDNGDAHEAASAPGGIIGFCLRYATQ